MDLMIGILLFAAGVAGGVANAIAGGATLLTFPAMLAAGLPPIVANASNAVAVTPGHLVAAIADRRKLPRMDRRFALTTASAVIGGGLGAVALFVTPEKLFTLLVPGLIGLATFVFACGKRIQGALPKLADGGSRSPLLAASSIYGGYFGAGLGVMLLAILTVTGPEDARTTNAMKNLLASAVSVVTVAIFSTIGLVSWAATAVMLAGAVTGGLLGAKLVAVLPEHVVRTVVVITGICMTLIYGARYWL
ncbi:sulfite exporter TauE/SafE family protein [Methylopila sp. 73B]|uniref:sulfite exporter TauE/SafE family protein n=1 Tax=Methylopila sp. 73B TaxID=1120792 RepID=UPI000368112D|nr:sulfite exporter TauE/SafE family protein [Methylopila sp. 73B]